MDRPSWSPASLSRKDSLAGSAGGSKHPLKGRSLASVTAGEGGDKGGAEAWQAAAAAVPIQRKPSTMQLLSAAAKVYLEGSSHGGSRRASNAAAAALAASGSSSVLRQVADDHSVAQRRRQLAGITDASTGSSSSASSKGGGGQLPPKDSSEGRQRGMGAAALAAGLPADRIAAGASRSGSGSLASPLRPAAFGGAAAGRAGSASSSRELSVDALAAPGTPAAAGAPPAAPQDPGSAGTPSGTPAGAAGSSLRGEGDLQGLRPHRVVLRRNCESPLVPGGENRFHDVGGWSRAGIGAIECLLL